MKENKKSIISKGINYINSPFSYARSAYARKARLVEILKRRFYDPSILSDIELAVDNAMTELGCAENYRDLWFDLCLALGINTFVDLTEDVKSRMRLEIVTNPPGLFFRKAHTLANARLRPLISGSPSSTDEENTTQKGKD